MRLRKKDRENLVDFLMKGSSLDDLLGILANICDNLDMESVNPRLSQFRHFQFTFFALLVKARGLLDSMLFRSESIRHGDIDGLRPDLLRLKRSLTIAYRDVNKDRMPQAKERIISARDQYSMIYTQIRNISSRLI